MDGRRGARAPHRIRRIDLLAVAPTTGAATILVVGDWSNYIIFDRIGSTRVELVPHVFGTNGRPTGQRGVYAYFRTGADVTSTGANPGFKLLINS